MTTLPSYLGGPATPTSPAAPLLPGQSLMDGGALVFWNSPASDGGSPITGYNVTVSQGGTLVHLYTLGVTDYIVLTGLTNGVSYLVAIQAMNAVGVGPAVSMTVAPAAPAPPASLPAPSMLGAPTGVSVAAGPRAGFVTVRWTLPDPIPASTNLLPNSSGLNVGWGAAGNAPVVTDNFAEAPDGNLTASKIALPAHLNTDSPPYSIHYGQLSPLTAGTVVTLSVWLRSDAPGFIDFLLNDGGAGGQSGRITCHTTTQWQKFTETLTLQTTSTGQYYVVFGSDHRFDGQSDQPGGTFYAWGLQVEPGTVATPWIPTHYAEPGTGTTSRPAQPITGVTVTQYPGGTRLAAGPTDTSMAVPVDDSGGHAYAFTVSATIFSGESAPSAPALISFASAPALPPPPPPPVAPGAPTLPGQSPLDGGALIFWNSPASDGGSPVVGYTVTVLQGATVVRSLTLGVTDFAVLSGLVNGSNYLATIQARTLAGTGPRASVSVVPAASSAAALVSAAPPPVVPGSPADTGGQFVKRDLQINFTTRRLTFVEGDLVFATGAQAILQDVWLALGFFEGEWFLDESLGVPVFRMVLVKGPNLDQVRALYRDTIAGRLGVKSVLSLQLTVDAPHRTLATNFRINTDVGQLASARTVRIGG